VASKHLNSYLANSSQARAMSVQAFGHNTVYLTRGLSVFHISNRGCGEGLTQGSQNIDLHRDASMHHSRRLAALLRDQGLHKLFCVQKQVTAACYNHSSGLACAVSPSHGYVVIVVILRDRRAARGDCGTAFQYVKAFLPGSRGDEGCGRPPSMSPDEAQHQQ